MNRAIANQAPTDAELMDSGAEADAKTVSVLRTRLAERAAREGIVDIAYRVVDTPVGSLLLATTEQGLVRVAFSQQGHDAALAGLADRISSRILHHPARLDRCARELEEYFAGTRREFDVPLDLQLSPGFRRGVLRQLRSIGYGQTSSYARIAQSAGSPNAARAVGTACATNPLPLVVPCHRVIHSDQTIGSYAGGAEAKAWLLDLEGAEGPRYSVPRR